MLRTTESDETEILLGNKQLLGVFFVVALLLAVAFYGGYMVGRGRNARTAITAPAAQQEAAANASTAGGETHVVSGGAGIATDENANSAQEPAPAQTQEPLGTQKRRPRPDTSNTEPTGATAGEPFAPQVGQQFLQVAAVSRDEAEAVADVLHKKGFRAHAVPKPGNAKIYRVIIGPIRDTADLSSTRDALMRTGFREVILQRY